jgi:hypothetical protein
MFKTATILALGFAVAAAFERDLQGQIASVSTNFTTACSRTTTETCTAAGYCCASVTRNGTAASTNTTAGLCVPAEFHTQTFNVSNTLWGFNCQLAATANTVIATQTACNDTNPCSNTTTQCCAPRQWTVGGVAGSGAARSACIARTNEGAQYWASWNVATIGSINTQGQVIATCPAVVQEETTSFGAYIKVSAMMVLALIAGMFF